MKHLKLWYLLQFVFSFSLIAESSWYDQKLEGWYYFEDPLEKSKEKQPTTLEEASEILESEKNQLHQHLALALLVPSTENVANYMKEQSKWINQSVAFAAAWKTVLLENPKLGDFLETPTTSHGILAKRSHDTNQRKSRLKQLSKNHFLLFLFQGKDYLSKKSAETIQLFAELNQWNIKAVSLDNHGLEEFPDAEIDKGISKLIDVQATPSFFIVNPYNNQVVPVGAGLLSVKQLEENIEYQFFNNQERSYEP
ncbi:MAG: conjugal transfer protein TraF [Simkaniaceae bacterium]|nr:conjugal transfer protein TraF [Simkaniaceae bacterium]